MAKGSRVRGVAAEGEAHEGEAPHTEELIRVATMVPKTIINGHILTVGTVVEMTQAEIDAHRAGGVPLDDVHADDKRDVYSVREPYVVPGD
jgi:hypothetical protein